MVFPYPVRTASFARSLESGAVSEGSFVVEVAADERTRVRLAECLAAHGAWAGQTQVFSNDPWKVIWPTRARDAFVPFLERPFSLLAWRDPVGHVESHEAALRALLAYARSRRKNICVLGSSSRLTEVAERLGFGSVWMGAEQEFALASFHLRGRQGEKLRLAVNHARRKACRARELFPMTSVDDAAAIRDIEGAWKSERRALRTNSFLRTAPFEYPHLRRYFGVEASAGPERPALQSLIVCSRVSTRRYYLQDFLRRPDAPRGATEMAVVEAFQTLRDDGVAFATMGIVPFFGRETPRTVGRLADVAQFLMRTFVYRFDGLQQFRAKFNASHVEPVYALHYPRSVSPFAVWDLAVSLVPGAQLLRRIEDVWVAS